MNNASRFLTQPVAWTRRINLSTARKEHQPPPGIGDPFHDESSCPDWSGAILESTDCWENNTPFWKRHHHANPSLRPLGQSQRGHTRPPPGMAPTEEVPPQASSKIRPPLKEAAPPSPPNYQPSNIDGIETIKTTLGQGRERCQYSERGGRRQTRRTTKDSQRRVRRGLPGRRAPSAHEGGSSERTLVCCYHCVGFLRLGTTRKTQTVHMHGAVDISRHRPAVPPPCVPRSCRIACAGCLKAAQHLSNRAANAEAPRTRTTERGSQELEHLVVRSAMEKTSCMGNICRTYQLLDKLREYHTRWELSRFRQEAAISTPMFEFASDSFPGAASIRNLALNLFYVHELGKK